MLLKWKRELPGKIHHTKNEHAVYSLPSAGSVCRIFFVLWITLFSCRKKDIYPERICNDPGNKSRPNIILILADDIGYEIPSYTGGQSYQTPTLDSLARSGMQFSHCYSSPNCCPSRIMLLTGKYGFRNYTRWGHMDIKQKTFANLLHDNGYFTCVAGKWQLDGGDASVRAFGFDDYMLWNPFAEDIAGAENDKGRYKNPKIYQNGSYLPASQTQGRYADDMFAEFICSFISNHTQCPFFIYYPMSLCHKPFSPTPDDAVFTSWNPENGISDVRYFPSMVKYMDKKVKQIAEQVKTDSLENNTYIFFVGDNGTDSISSLFNGRWVTGRKGTSTEMGTHVPFFVSASGNILPGETNDNLVDFTDFFETIADVSGNGRNTLSGSGTPDGRSFYSQLHGDNSDARSWIYCYWKPTFARTSDMFRIYAQTKTYKLYDALTYNNNFYNLAADSLEQNPLAEPALSGTEISVKQQLQQVLNEMHN